MVEGFAYGDVVEYDNDDTNDMARLKHGMSKPIS